MPIIASRAGGSATSFGGLGASVVVAAVGDFNSIQTVTVGSGGQASISFTSIPATFKHLQIRGIARSTTTGNDAWMYYELNGDTTASNYSNHNLFGDGTTATGSYNSGSDGNLMGRAMGSASGATSVFAANIMDILDYANTSKYKVLKNLTGQNNNGSRQLVGFSSNLWRNTAAITTITLFTANNFAEYSSFALYGIKG